MTAILRFSLIFVICVWACHAQLLGRTVRTYMPAPVEPCFSSSGSYSNAGSGPDELSSLLALARLIESSQNQNQNQNQKQNLQPCGCPKSDINTEDIIHKLIDALISATSHNKGGSNSGYGTATDTMGTSGSYSSTGSQAQGVVTGLLKGVGGSNGQHGNEGVVIQLLQSLLGGGANQGAVTGLLSGLLGSSGGNQGVVPHLLEDVVGPASGGGNGVVTNLLGGLLGGSSGGSNGVNNGSNGNSGLVGGLLGGGGGGNSGLLGGLAGGGNGGASGGNSGVVGGSSAGGDSGVTTAGSSAASSVTTTNQ